MFILKLIHVVTIIIIRLCNNKYLFLNINSFLIIIIIKLVCLFYRFTNLGKNIKQGKLNLIKTKKSRLTFPGKIMNFSLRILIFKLNLKL
jgi:hypothetical protein